MLALLLPTLLFTATASPQSVAVLPAQLEGRAATLIQREILTETLLTAVSKLPGAEAIGQDDLDAMLSFERQQELLGCDDVTCFTQIGGTFGVARLVVMKTDFVNNEWVVVSRLIGIVDPVDLGSVPAELPPPAAAVRLLPVPGGVTLAVVF